MFKKSLYMDNFASLKKFYSNHVNFKLKEIEKCKPAQLGNDSIIKRNTFFGVKLLIAQGAIYGSNEIGVWGPAQESSVLLKNIEEFAIENSMKFIDSFCSKN